MATTPKPVATPCPAPSRWSAAAIIALAALAAVAACNQICDFDTFWHLRAGGWMLEHRALLDHNPFSVTQPDQGNWPWVNVYWLFQLAIAGVYALGGWTGLVLLKMAALAALATVLTLALRKMANPAWLMCVGLWLIVTLENRIRIRPEIVTFILLLTTLLLLDWVRRDGRVRRLWWLAPIVVLWVNMHGLYFMGLVAAWAAVAGDWLDRLLKRPAGGQLAKLSALPPMLTATLAALASPWPVQAALHPLLLSTRLGGLYGSGVIELQPSYLVNPLTNFPLLMSLAGLLALLVFMLINRRQAPLAHVLWLIAFAIPAAMALRNLGLLTVPLAFLLGMHGGQVMAKWRKGRQARLVAPLAMLAIISLTAVGYATEWMYRWQDRPVNHFGLGLVQDYQPAGLAQWLENSPAGGDILDTDFGQASVFLHFTPGRKVWMDGRLEVYDRARFEQLLEYRQKMLDPLLAAHPNTMPLPPSVRFIVVPTQEVERVAALANCPSRFAPVYVDPGAVCFARLPLPDEPVTWASSPPPQGNLAALTASQPRPVVKRLWYRQNALSPNWQLGINLYSLQLYRPAIRYLRACDVSAVSDSASLLATLAQSYQILSEANQVEPDGDLPVDINLTCALAAYKRIDFSRPEAMDYALVRVRAMIGGRQMDSAEAALRSYLGSLPPERLGQVPDALNALRDTLASALATARGRTQSFDIPGLAPPERALLLLRKDVGLIDRAIDQLSSAKDLPARATTMLGDLYLRKGLVAPARACYRPAMEWSIQMRLGLCDWAEGNLELARRKLSAARALAPDKLQPVVYLATLLEEIGQSDMARDLAAKTLSASSPEDSQERRLLEAVVARNGGR